MLGKPEVEIHGTAKELGPLGIKFRLPMVMGMPTYAGTSTTAGGLVFFAGFQDFYLRAYDAETGAQKWRWYSVPHAAVGALSVDQGAHVWDLARLAIALLGSETRLTVPVGEITDNEAGSVVVWNSDTAQALFEALRTGGAIPHNVFDAQP